MDLDERIAAVKELIAKREEIDARFAELFGGAPAERKERRCKVCNGVGHRSDACPTKQTENDHV